jgi:putative hydroxymethylpyrimidine transport system ATP-binding protein
MSARIFETTTAEPPIGITLRGATLAFGEKLIFAGLDLDVPAGRTTCLLGPSGVGKSSLLRLIAGISPEAAAESLTASRWRSPSRPHRLYGSA